MWLSSLPGTGQESETFEAILKSKADGVWKFKDGYFWQPAASGETYEYFSIPTSMTKNSDGTYSVSFNAYHDPTRIHEGYDPNWYTYTVDTVPSYCEYYYNGNAVIKPKVYNGENTYELVSYNTERN